MATPYDSLLLSCGGGIINAKQQSPQNRTSAALAIGIGGTGVAALAELKKKVYQQLEPDDPESPIPRYDHIQFLAIDSDTSDIDKMNGRAKLDKSEFFSIHNPTLRAVLTSKKEIMDDPLMNWMDIKKIDDLLSPLGAGGVREVGRYLLISKASALKTKIESKCITALKGLGTSAIDVYIFAGISGGTGSGCFIDTCYIVRQALKENGWNGSGNILGLFFLPDVVLNKPEVRAVEAAVQYNSSNGYAAMKELDYLMSLKTSNDEFYQNYGSFAVKTQEAPVDMCHLISATQADGTIMEDGFSYGINVAADYVMSYLAKVEGAAGDEAAADVGLTMKGHLANVNNGVSGLKRKYGADLSYHILGAASAEIPMTQISTYLASGFYRRFIETIGRERRQPSKAEVDAIVRELKLTARDIRTAVENGVPVFGLPEMDIRSLLSYFPVERGNLPSPWATAHNSWLDNASGKLHNNAVALAADLPKHIDARYDNTQISEDSLIGRLFRKLYDLSVDPEYGPYYAARVLKCEGYDIVAAVEGITKELDENGKTADMYLHGKDGIGGNDDRLRQAGTNFYNRRNNRTYAAYIDAVREHAILNKDIACLSEAVKLMRGFKEKVIDLSDDFFRVFTDLLDNLTTTFGKNEEYLGSDLAKSTTAYTWRIFELDDVKPRLDDVIDELNPRQLVNDFVRHLLNNYNEWHSKDEDKIRKCISAYMVTLNVFSSQVNRSLEDFLYDKYPNVHKGDVMGLAAQVRDDIIVRLDNQATPMFWMAPVFKIEETFRTSSISVPAIASAICSAADQYKENRAEYVIRKTGIKDRIFASCFFSGVPFYAYQGTTLLRRHYTEGRDAAYGAGAHLYAKTGRGIDGTGMKDWRTFLPNPTSPSLEQDAFPDLASGMALYDAGVEKGIIRQKPEGDYVILKTKPIDVKKAKLEDYLTKTSELDNVSLDADRRKLVELLSEITDLNSPSVQTVTLKNDGAVAYGEEVVTRVRKDYFLRFPVLQQIVRDELAKRADLEGAIACLDGIKEEYAKYNDVLGTFSRLIFFDKIKCADGMMNSVWKASDVSISIINYTYLRNNAEETFAFLTEGKDEAGFASKYPLYLAFSNYQKLDPDDLPRRELDDYIRERKETTGPKVRSGEHEIAKKLKAIWTPKAITNLEKEIAYLPFEKQRDIMRFYRGLVHEIDEFLKLFGTISDRIPEETNNMSSAYVPTPTANPRVLVLWDGASQKQLYAYEQYGLDKAFDQTTNSWVPLNPQTMLVWNAATNNWDMMLLDPNGRIMNK